MRFRSHLANRVITILCILALLSSFATVSVSHTKAQGVSYETTEQGVVVTVGSIRFTIKPSGGITDLYIGDSIAMNYMGFYPFRTGWSWGAGTWYYGEVVESPKVEETPNGIIVRTHSRFPPQTQCYLEFTSVYVIYNTGMIIANLTARAYENFKAAWIPIYAGFSTEVFGGSKFYFAYGKSVTEVACPKEYKIYRLSSGSFSVAYTSTPRGDLVIIALSPPSLSYLFDDDRRWGGTSFAIKCGLTGFEVEVSKGEEFKASIMLYPHTKGSEFTKKIVDAFSSLGAAKGLLEALSKTKPRTPGGAKLLSSCKTEVELAYKAFNQGDIDGTYVHAKNAIKYAEEMKTVERNQRILLYIVLPNLIELVIAILVIMRTKPIRRAST